VTGVYFQGTIIQIKSKLLKLLSLHAFLWLQSLDRVFFMNFDKILVFYKPCYHIFVQLVFNSGVDLFYFFEQKLTS